MTIVRPSRDIKREVEGGGVFVWARGTLAVQAEVSTLRISPLPNDDNVRQDEGLEHDAEPLY